MNMTPPTGYRLYYRHMLQTPAGYIIARMLFLEHNGKRAHYRFTCDDPAWQSSEHDDIEPTAAELIDIVVDLKQSGAMCFGDH